MPLSFVNSHFYIDLFCHCWNYNIVKLLDRVIYIEANQLNLFRSIALCNVVYKIISRLLAERLKVWLPMVISVEKGGFVVGIYFGWGGYCF